MKKRNICLAATSALVIAAAGALLSSNRTISITAAARIGTFVLDGSSNGWTTNQQLYQVESDLGTYGRAQVYAHTNWGSTAEQSDGNYVSFTFDGSKSSCEARVEIYVRGMTSILWEFDKKVDILINPWSHTWSAVESKTITSSSAGAYNFATQNTSSQTVDRIVLALTSSTAETVTVKRVQVTYNADMCEQSLTNTPTEM